MVPVKVASLEGSEWRKCTAHQSQEYDLTLSKNQASGTGNCFTERCEMLERRQRGTQRSSAQALAAQIAVHTCQVRPWEAYHKARGVQAKESSFKVRV